MRSFQSGQAMLEFLVASSFVLVPFLFLVTYLGKTGDVQHRAYEGARYVAWERAKTNKADAHITSEINKRLLYAEVDGFNSTEDRKSDNNDPEEIDHLYRYQESSGKYQDLLVLDDESFVRSETKNSQPGGSVHQLRSSTLNSGLVGYDLEEDGLLSASVQYKMTDMKYLSENLAISPSATNVMYIESWRQLSNDEVKDAMQVVVFGERAFNNPIFNTIATAADFIGFQEFGEFEPGFVRPDVVPCSRIVGGGGNRETACK